MKNVVDKYAQLEYTAARRGSDGAEEETKREYVHIGVPRIEIGRGRCTLSYERRREAPVASRFVVSMTPKPVPSKSKNSRCARCMTAGGNAAGPGPKLKRAATREARMASGVSDKFTCGNSVGKSGNTFEPVQMAVGESVGFLGGRRCPRLGRRAGWGLTD